MSRTYKDRPDKVRFPTRTYLYGNIPVAYETTDWNGDTVLRYSYIQEAGIKPKLRKEKDTEWHWMATPSWWTRLTMNRPQRREGRAWERKIHFQDLEDADPPGVSHKPHIYYW